MNCSDGTVRAFDAPLQLIRLPLISLSLSFTVQSSTKRSGLSARQMSIMFRLLPQVYTRKLMEAFALLQRYLPRLTCVLLSPISHCLLVSASGVLLKNMKQHDRVVKSLAKTNTLLDVAKLMNTEIDMTNLIGTMMREARKLLGADKTTVFLLDPQTDELWSKHTAEAQEIRFPVTEGIAGAVVTSGEPINIKNAYADKVKGLLRVFTLLHRERFFSHTPYLPFYLASGSEGVNLIRSSVTRQVPSCASQYLVVIRRVWAVFRR